MVPATNPAFILSDIATYYHLSHSITLHRIYYNSTSEIDSTGEVADGEVAVYRFQ